MNSGDVISYFEMCQREQPQLQRGMNYQIGGNYSVFLMSVRENSPYNDEIEDDGTTLIYEGHDERRSASNPEPKLVDQPMFHGNGNLTQNGLFFQAASQYKANERDAEKIRVYEKIKSGIWVYNGVFDLVDAWTEQDENNRRVFKFKLQLQDKLEVKANQQNFEHARFIPSHIKLAVWKRDKGICIKCGSDENLHFDHIIPYSKGGTSLSEKNIQLLCMKCNLSKRDKIE